MTTEVLYSPILDTNIAKNVAESPIWDSICMNEEEWAEYGDGDPSYKVGWYRYEIKFDGLKPVQCTKYEAV